MIQFSQKSFEKGRQKMSRLLLLYTKRINTTNERRCCCLLELSTVFCSHLLLLLFAPFSFPGFDAHQLRAVRHRFGPSKGRVSFPPPVGVFPNVPVVAPVAGVTVFTYSSVWPVFFSPVFGEFMAVAVIPGGAFAFALATVGGVGTPSFGPTFTPGTTAAAVFADVSICPRAVRFHAPAFAIPFFFPVMVPSRRVAVFRDFVFTDARFLETFAVDDAIAPVSFSPVLVPFCTIRVCTPFVCGTFDFFARIREETSRDVRTGDFRPRFLPDIAVSVAAGFYGAEFFVIEGVRGRPPLLFPFHGTVGGLSSH